MVELSTLSQICAWDVDHLTAATTHWTNTANQWDDTFTLLAQRMASPSGVPWSGGAADSAQQKAGADWWAVRRLADRLHGAAGIARAGVSDLRTARQQVISTVGEAHGAGFAVWEDLSVSDRQAAQTPTERAIRTAQAEAFTSEIRSRAAALAELDSELAARIASAAMALRDTPRGASAGVETKVASFFTAPFPEKPPNPPPQPPPGGWSDDPLTRAAQKIAYGHAYREHLADFSGMTPDQLAQQIEKMFRANTENPGSLSIGRTADGAPVLYDPKTNLIVIRDPRGADLGTAFRPDDGATYAETRKMNTRVVSIPPSELADGPVNAPPPPEPKPQEQAPPRPASPVRAAPLFIPPELIEFPHGVGDGDLPILESNGQDAGSEVETER